MMWNKRHTAATTTNGGRRRAFHACRLLRRIDKRQARLYRTLISIRTVITNCRRRLHLKRQSTNATSVETFLFDYVIHHFSSSMHQTAVVIIRTHSAYSVNSVLVRMEFCVPAVSWSVHPSAGNNRAFWKNSRLEQDAIWGGVSGGPQEQCIRWDLDPPCEKAIFLFFFFGGGVCNV